MIIELRSHSPVGVVQLSDRRPHDTLMKINHAIQNTLVVLFITAGKRDRTKHSHQR